jgi:hypothetical protein
LENENAPQPQREWVGLTETDLANCDTDEYETARHWERLLREKNGGGEYSQDTHQPRADTHQPCNPAEDGVCEALECCKDTANALLLEAIGLLMQMPIKHPQQGEYREDLIKRIGEHIK